MFSFSVFRKFIEAFQNATHFPGSRRFFPQAGVQSRVKIQMIKNKNKMLASAEDINEIIHADRSRTCYLPRKKCKENKWFEGLDLH